MHAWLLKKHINEIRWFANVLASKWKIANKFVISHTTPESKSKICENISKHPHPCNHMKRYRNKNNKHIVSLSDNAIKFQTSRMRDPKQKYPQDSTIRKRTGFKLPANFLKRRTKSRTTRPSMKQWFYFCYKTTANNKSAEWNKINSIQHKTKNFKRNKKISMIYNFSF